MADKKNRRRPPQEDDGTLIEGRNAVLETLRAGRAVDKVRSEEHTSELQSR